LNKFKFKLNISQSGALLISIN